MAELTKQEKKILEGKFKKAFKGLVKEGYDKKELKKFDFDTLDIDDEKKNEFINADDAQFVELLKKELSPQEETNEAPAEDNSSDEVQEKQAEAPVEETPVEEAQTSEDVQEETPVEEPVQEEQAAAEETPVAEEEAQAEQAPAEEETKSAQEEFLEIL